MTIWLLVAIFYLLLTVVWFAGRAYERGQRGWSITLVALLVSWPVAWMLALWELGNKPCTCATSTDRCPRHG